MIQKANAVAHESSPVMSGKETSSQVDPTKRLRQIVTLGALLLALAHLIWPSLAIDAITLGLLVIAIIPWLAPLIKSLELPGGWKIELQDVQKVTTKTEEAGLASPNALVVGPEVSYSFQMVADRDPNLALAGLRIEIERRLVQLAEQRGLTVRSAGVGNLLRVLDKEEVLSHKERSALADMLNLLNSAVHGARIQPQAAEWAIEFGPRLLSSLDAKITRQVHG